MKFSQKTTGTTKLVNKEGGEAFSMKPIEQLVQIVSTNLMGEPKFYGDVQKEMDTAIEYVADTDPEFILQLARFCRNELYLRTVSVYLLVKAANIVKCKPFIKNYTPHILKRADELYEALACQLDLFKKPIPNSLKKGIKATFPNFDEYQFAKYDRKTKVTFRDAVMLTHTKEPSEIIKKIMDKKLETPYTWETELSTKGNTQEIWQKLIDSRKVGYMATLKNINNIHKVKVDDEHWKKVMELISNANIVRKSKQLPFRFYSALKNTAVDDPFRNKELQHALNTALEVSVENLPKLKGRTMISCDASGSMSCSISKKSNITPHEIGCLMGAMANKFSENAIASLFGNDFAVVPDLSGDILKDTQALRSVNVGHSTNGYLAIQYLNQKDIVVDRVLIFTDEELYGGSINSEWETYTRKYPNAKLYVINLTGYGQSCINLRSKSVVTVSGWSDKILSFIATYEEGKQSFIERIKKYKPMEG